MIEFGEALDILAGPPVVSQVAEASGLSLNSISRAKVGVGSHKRPPPRGWTRIVRDMAERRIAELTSLASELADA